MEMSRNNSKKLNLEKISTAYVLCCTHTMCNWPCNSRCHQLQKKGDIGSVRACSASGSINVRSLPYTAASFLVQRTADQFRIGLEKKPTSRVSKEFQRKLDTSRRCKAGSTNPKPEMRSLRYISHLKLMQQSHQTLDWS